MTRSTQRAPARPWPKSPPTQLVGTVRIVFGAFALIFPPMVLVGQVFPEMLTALWAVFRGSGAGSVFLDLSRRVIPLLVLYPILVCCPFFLFGLWLLISGRALLKQSNRLVKHGRVASGVILYRFGVPGLRYAGVAYRFEVPLDNGQVQVFTQAEYNQKARRRLEVGDRVSVRYLPENPAICRLEVDIPPGTRLPQ